MRAREILVGIPPPCDVLLRTSSAASVICGSLRIEKHLPTDENSTVFTSCLMFAPWCCICKEVFKNRISASRHFQGAMVRGKCIAERTYNLEQLSLPDCCNCSYPSCSFIASNIAELQNHLATAHFQWISPPNSRPQHGSRQGTSSEEGKRGHQRRREQGETGQVSSARGRTKEGVSCQQGSGQQPATGQQLGGVCALAPTFSRQSSGVRRRGAGSGGSCGRAGARNQSRESRDQRLPRAQGPRSSSVSLGYLWARRRKVIQFRRQQAQRSGSWPCPCEDRHSLAQGPWRHGRGSCLLASEDGARVVLARDSDAREADMIAQQIKLFRVSKPKITSAKVKSDFGDCARLTFRFRSSTKASSLAEDLQEALRAFAKDQGWQIKMTGPWILTVLE